MGEIGIMQARRGLLMPFSEESVLDLRRDGDCEGVNQGRADATNRTGDQETIS